MMTSAPMRPTGKQGAHVGLRTSPAQSAAAENPNQCSRVVIGSPAALPNTTYPHLMLHLPAEGYDGVRVLPICLLVLKSECMVS